jgi:hypothetical protein
MRFSTDFGTPTMSAIGFMNGHIADSTIRQRLTDLDPLRPGLRHRNVTLNGDNQRRSGLDEAATAVVGQSVRRANSPLCGRIEQRREGSPPHKWRQIMSRISRIYAL